MKELKKYVKNLRLVEIAVLIFLAGAIIGVICGKLLEASYSTGLTELYTEFFHNVGNVSINEAHLLQVIVIRNCKTFFISLIICTTIAGIPYIICYFVYKGFVTGFLLYFTLAQYKLKGLLFFLLYLFPQALVYVPVMLYLLLKGYDMNRQLHHSLKSKGSTKRMLVNLLPNFITLLVLLLVGSILEAYVNSSILQKVLPLLFQ